MRNYEECRWAHGQKRDGGFTTNYSESSTTYHMDEIIHDIAWQDFDWEQVREQPINSDTKAFEKLLEEGRESLWHGYTEQTKLFVAATLQNIKADHNISHECFKSLLKAIKRAEMRTRVMRLPIVPFGKTKDNDKARLNLKDICKRPALELRQSFNGKDCQTACKVLTEGSTLLGNVQSLAMGPDMDQVSRNGYKVNGYEFHIKAYGRDDIDTKEEELLINTDSESESGGEDGYESKQDDSDLETET
ncbi:hypothetical protein AgCh_012807 [Apium graveolens]